ncbi:MAG: helix-turn-helix domain-containing protein [Candidatus Hydrogenedentes bacterium]|nr:helix-turn-helix domain-containing protein [Candidatus Hydrogenedentota bacterium]
MTPLLFLQQPEVQQILSRAGKAAGTPVAVHYLHRGEEGPRITGIGQSALCRYVQDLPGGPMVCRGCRIKASLEALRDGMASPFLCHMGLGCVAAPVFPETVQGFVITFGPYCPAEAPETLADDARSGLFALGDEKANDLDALLSDIHLVYSGAILEIVEWTVDSLKTLWETWQKEPEKQVLPLYGGTRPSKKKVRNAPEADPYRAGAIAAALAGGKQREVRAAILTVLAESPVGERNVLPAGRARAMALVGAVMEAAERAKLNAGGCWERLPEFVEEIGKARTNTGLANAVTGVLRVIRHDTKRVPKDTSLTALNKILLPRLGEQVTLNAIAAELGEPPSTITRRLQRKLGVSFSEYLGKQRVSRAKQLLRRTRLGIGEVARRVGINDTSNFAKVFRKFEGCSPQQYRLRFGRK